ncbi:MAG: hypothetical protein HQL81_14155 [Magnetococcales bacterium]|nr:hypothetical protein [Magnetococcales bacterium]
MIFTKKTYKSTPAPTPRTPPRPVVFLLLLGLVMQLLWGILRPPPTAKTQDLPPPPSSSWLQLATLGDPVALARILMLWLQGFDDQPGLILPLRHLDDTTLEQWLELILSLDPRSDYPLFVALYLYAGTPDRVQTRIMLDFVQRHALLDLKQRWRWLAFAAVIAHHRLNDPQLALRYLDALFPALEQGDLPPWVFGERLSLLHATGQPERARRWIDTLQKQRPSHAPSETRFFSDWLEKLKEEN